MDFAAIDVETANADVSSICQIGIVVYRNGQVVEEWETLVNPESHFDGINTSIHGISQHAVNDAPVFKDIYPDLVRLLGSTISVSHTGFDRSSIGKAAIVNGLSDPALAWLDTAKVTRRTWPDYAWKGYGLGNVCKHLGYSFNHHDALSDAKACAFILIQAIEKTGFTVEEWLRLSGKAIATFHATEQPETIVESDDLSGEVVVFTGQLSMIRSEAARLATAAGADVKESVTKKTTLVVVGDQDISRLAGHDKSSKHRKAEDLIAKGAAIRIVIETDFLNLLGKASGD